MPAPDIIRFDCPGTHGDPHTIMVRATPGTMPEEIICSMHNLTLRAGTRILTSRQVVTEAEKQIDNGD